METTKKEKAFDAVKMMRDTRDKISSETQNMSFVEFKEYIRTKLEVGKAKRVKRSANKKAPSLTQ